MSPPNQNITLFTFLIRWIIPIWVHAQILYATTERHWPTSVLVYCERFGGRHGVLSYRLCVQRATSLCLEAKRILLHLHAHLVRTLRQNVLYQLDNFHTIKVTLQFGNCYFLGNLLIWAAFAFRCDSLGFVIILPLRIHIFRNCSHSIGSLRCGPISYQSLPFDPITQIKSANWLGNTFGVYLRGDQWDILGTIFVCLRRLSIRIRFWNNLGLCFWSARLKRYICVSYLFFHDIET